MILEVALLNIKTGQEVEFESAFMEAQHILANTEGYISHQLQHCLKEHGRYLLLVNWQTLEHHSVGFRGSSEYTRWSELLHHFYEPFPTVEHYSMMLDHSG